MKVRKWPLELEAPSQRLGVCGVHVEPGMVFSAVELPASGIPVRQLAYVSRHEAERRSHTDARDVESSTKSGWLAAQSMRSAFERNEFNGVST